MGRSSDVDRTPVDDLLRLHGRTFASEAGIRLARGTPAPLFQLLVLTLLSSARISADIAMSATRALLDDGLTTPRKMADATWEHRTAVLNGAGYARYDESTSRYLEATADLVLDRWGGDLRNLRARADGDTAVATDLLTECKGIGPAGAQMFVREVQQVWDEFDPFVDDRARAVADRLGLPTTPAKLRDLVDGRREFVRLLDALVRCGLAGDEDRIRGAAR